MTAGVATAAGLVTQAAAATTSGAITHGEQLNASNTGYLGNEASLTLVNSQATATAAVPGSTWSTTGGPHWVLPTGSLLISGVHVMGAVRVGSQGSNPQGHVTIEQSVIELSFVGFTSISTQSFAEDPTTSSFTLNDVTVRAQAGQTPGGANVGNPAIRQGAWQDANLEWHNASATLTLNRCNISGAADGYQGDNGLISTTTFTDTYFHSFGYYDGAAEGDNTHTDGAQMYGGTYVFNRCKVDTSNVNLASPDSPNAALFGQVADTVVRANSCYLDGGGYTYYAQGGNHYVDDCVFGDIFKYGRAVRTGSAVIAQWTNNRTTTGTSVTAP